MSLEEWVHDEDSLEYMRDNWGRKKNILENGRGVPAEEDFKGCQGLGCEESPDVEEEEASKEGLGKI